MKNLIYITLTTVFLFASIKCKKMDVRPNSSIIMPKTVSDFERLMEHDAITSTPALPHLGSDEYFLRDYATWQSLFSTTQKNAYIWEKDVYGGEMEILDWNYPFQGIFYCNSVLDHISILNNLEDRRRIEGWALLARAFLLHSLVTTFADAYNPSTAEKDLGIPLKLRSDIDEIEPRSTLDQIFSQIIRDALKAADLLPNEKPLLSKNHPSKVASYALLARVYLNMGDYNNADLYADNALNIYNVLTDYNTLDTLLETPFTDYGDEIIYFSRQIPDYSTSSYGRSTTYGVSENVLKLYSSNDLRFPIYFLKNQVGNYRIKSINIPLLGRPFTGLAVDELYLIKAECLARANKEREALEYLNQLVMTRMETGTFVPIDGVGESVLDLVLLERRKALVWRGLRWVDLKRLNKKGANITLTRELNGVKYTLPPNDPRYIFPAPYGEIN